MRLITALLLSLVTLHASAQSLVEVIEQTHNRDGYYGHPAVQADVVLEWGGKPAFSGTMTFDAALGKARLDLTNGTTVVFDGERAWVSPADSPFERGRFHVLTWPYFLIAPFKLSDPGVTTEPAGRVNVDEDTRRTAVKMSFAEGTGDAPDDIYWLMPDDDGRLAALGYIVTYSKPEEEAMKKPSLVLYDGFQTVDGVTFGTALTFYYWDPQKGHGADAKGVATFSDIRFLDAVEPGTFDKPADAREDQLPGG